MSWMKYLVVFALGLLIVGCNEEEERDESPCVPYCMAQVNEGCGMLTEGMSCESFCHENEQQALVLGLSERSTHPLELFPRQCAHL